MNWRNKNKNPPSSSGLSSSLSSWFSKFKPNRRKSNYPLAKTKQKSRSNSPIVPSSPLKDVIDQGILQSVFYSSQDELDFEFPFSTSRSCRSYTKEFKRDQEDDDSHKFSDMVSDLRKMRILNEEDQDEERQEKMLETPRRKIQKGRKITRNKRDEAIFDVLYSDSGRESADIAEKKFLDLEETEEIRMVKSDIEVSNCHYISSSNSKAENEKDKLQRNENGTVSKQKKSLKVSSSEKQRKSVYISRESQRRKVKQSCKVRAYSPRTAASKLEICKIRALEDKKKAKNKKKEGPALESYAIEKSSFDPEKDFRESMEEMIEEIGIWKAEGLENLLACYLSLNSTEYHDIIVKVFRQVWLDLNKHYSSSYSELQNDDYCYINDR